MNSCKLGNGKIEFLKDMDRVVSNAATESEENIIPKFKSGLKELLSKYENAIDEFKESVKEYLDDPYGDYQISEIEESIAEEFRNSIDDVFTNIENELD
jgi:hypothetical protein